MADEFSVRLLDEVRPLLAGLDPERVAARVREQVRSRHAAPAPLSHEGPPVESAVVHAARKLRRGFRLAFRYACDRHPNSRYDKSLTTEGWLTVSDDAGALLRGAIGELRRWRPAPGPPSRT